MTTLKLKNLVSILCCICFATLNILSATVAQEEPRFEAYAVPVWRGRIAPVNLRSARGASNVRTRLREGVRNEGVNFAGHYTFISIGCGTGCTHNAVVDARNGRVFFPDELSGWNFYIGEDWGVAGDEDVFQYHANSRLLRAIGCRGGGESQQGVCGIHYYEWVNNRLRRVRFIRKSDPPR